MESRLAGITAGNGAIYAVRREAYIELDPSRGQDIGFPFELTKRGWRAVYEPTAVAEERMAPTVEGEFRRKRRMMWGLWDVMLKWGMLDPRGYGPGYALEIYSHRLLRYLTPWLHLIALGANLALLGEGGVYTVTMALQLALLLGGRPRAASCRAAVPGGLLLRHRHRLDRSRALGPAAGRSRADRLGEGGGNPMSDTNGRCERRAAAPRRAGAAPRPRACRGAADLAIAVFGLVLGSPILLAAAIAIKLGSRGPVIYRQRRVGRDGEMFEMWKLRTMRRGADPVGVGTAVVADDPRVTRVGRCCAASRSTSCRTSSTSCGARWRSSARAPPCRPRSSSTRRASAAAWTLKPGVTGWAQIHGRAGIPWEERIELDVWYVEHRSLRLDLRILARTPGVLIGGAGGVRPDRYAGSPPDSPLRRAAEREEARRAMGGTD